MPAKVTLTDAPDHTLPLTPVCKSLSDVDHALEELAFINARKATIEGLINDQVAQLKAEYEDQFAIVIEGTAIRFDDRVPALENAIRSFAAKHRDTLLANQETKTISCQHGAIQFVKSPASVVAAPNCSPLEIISSMLKLVGKALDLLRSLPLLGKSSSITADQIIDLTPKLNMSRVKDLWKRELITEKQLNRLGFEVTEETEDVRIKPGDYARPSRSEKRPA